MRSTSNQLLLTRVIAWTACFTTLAVLPATAYDPINVPKLAVIAVGGFMALGVLFAERNRLFQSKYRLVHVFAAAFIFDLLLVLIISGTNFNQEMFGTFGRATGFIAYFSLCILFLASVVAASISTLSKISWTLLATGGASIIYGGIQAVGADPIKWVNKYNSIIGFLGNPNFQSSFVGFNGIVAFALMLGATKRALRLFMATDLAISVIVIGATDSQQGFLVLAGGISLLVLFWVKSSKFKAALIPGIVMTSIAGIFVTLGSLNNGPLASLLYKDSVTYRGDYWRAGWNMTLEHPIFGVGLDSYGDWYRRARSVEATLRRGPEVVSNASHNVLLDLSSNGGFPLLFIYMLLLGLVFMSGWRVLRRTKRFEPHFSSLFVVWLAYQAQSIISLNQLGLAVWGWIISGLIIGYEINTRVGSVSEVIEPKGKKRMTSSTKLQQKMSSGLLLSVCVGGVFGITAGMPPLIGSSKYLSALKSQNPKVIQQAANIWPQNPYHTGQVVILLANNEFPQEALDVLEQGIQKFPDEFPLWKLLSEISSSSLAQKAEAKAQMKRLDPHNPDLK